MSFSPLDAPQVLKTVYDKDADALKVTNVASESSSIGLFTLPYDAITVDYPDTVTEVYTSHTGGTSGPVVQVVTVIYTDASKADLLSAERA